MTATAITTAPADATWDSLILSERPAAKTWEDIFSKLGSLAVSTTNPGLLHRETTTPDRLIAECAVGSLAILSDRRTKRRRCHP